MTQYLNVKSASDYLNIKPSTLYRLVSKGLISVYQPGRFLLFTKEDLDEYMNKGRKVAINS